MFNLANMFGIQDVGVRGEQGGKVRSEGFNFLIVKTAVTKDYFRVEITE